MSTAVLYLDEGGNVDPHSSPLANGQSPVFSLAGISLRLGDWRPVDREYLRLKQNFFRKELGGLASRPEQWEPKDICAPRNAKDKRRHGFIREVLALLGRYDAKAFTVTFLKSHVRPTPANTLYTMGLQHTAERFNAYVSEHPDLDQGIIIADSRQDRLDLQVGASYLSYVFGHTTGRQLTCLQEGPLFAYSKLTAGVQIAHIVANLLAGNHYYYYCRKFPGALDYSHLAQYWPAMDSLQFRSRAEFEGRIVYGFKVHDYRET